MVENESMPKTYCPFYSYLSSIMLFQSGVKLLLCRPLSPVSWINVFPSLISDTCHSHCNFCGWFWYKSQIPHAEAAAQIVRAQCLDLCCGFGFLCLQRNETLNSNNNCLFQSGHTITFVI